MRKSLLLFAGLALAPAVAVAVPCDEVATPTGVQKRIRQVQAPADRPAGLRAYTVRVGDQEEDVVRTRRGRAVASANFGGSENGRSYRVVVDDGQVEAFVDGRKLPASQVKYSGGAVYLFDANGREIKKFPVQFGEGAVVVEVQSQSSDDDRFFAGGRNVVRGVQFPGQAAVAPGTPFGVPAPAPKVMLGIVMGSPDEALQHHLGIGANDATVLTNVLPGLPASAAGLQTFDVIIAVDGASPASANAIRKAIAEKSPGDALKFKVMRGGATKDVTVTLEAFDPARMGGASGAAGGQTLKLLEDMNVQIDDERLQGMLDRLRSGAVRGDIAVAPGNGDDMYFRVMPSPPAPASPPAPPGWRTDSRGSGTGGMGARIEQLEDQIDELNQRLDLLLRKLERISD